MSLQSKMVVCFLCETVIKDLRALRAHFQFFHYGHSFEQYRCAENDCSRSYHLFNSFRRHYLRTHSAQVTNTENNIMASEQVPSSSVQSSTRPVSISNDELAVVEPEAFSCLRHVPLETAIASLIAVLYGSANLPRNIVQITVDNLLNILSHSVVPLINELLQSMADRGEIIFTNSISDAIHTIHNKIISDFSAFSTEYRRFNFFERRLTYIAPQEIAVGECRSSKTVRGRQVVSSCTRTMQFIPLRKVLYSFFSLDSLLVDTLQYMKDLDNDEAKIQNFIQGNYWKSRRRVHSGKNVVPLFLFFDDYETSNALGSHSGIHKLGAVYISLPSLPPWRCSTLSNIFLTLLLHSSDRSQFGNNVIFQPIIDELNFLSTVGITFDVPNFTGTVYFELALIIGDNLGIHSIIGFIESFSANYPCRICKIKKEDMKTKSYEDKTLLRDNDDYDADLLEGIPANSGIKEKCVWLKVSGFQLFKQVGVDVMHDILEGVAKYVMGLVLKKCIYRFKYFSLALLNDRLGTFAYGPDARNKPVELSMHHINQCHIRLSASEMLTFIRYFSVIVGDKVPGGDSYWLLYLKLREIVELVSATCVWTGLDAVLQDCVTELNNMYLHLSNESLKPKFHHLTHYHNAMINYGPLTLFSSMRYEAKHRLAKTSARASSNRKNITFSLAVKHQLKLNEIFLRGALDPILTWGPKKLKTMPSDLELIQSCLNLKCLESLFRVSWVAMSSVRYKKGSILVYDQVPVLDRNDLTFLVVDNLYLYDNIKVILTGTLLKTIFFDCHYYAYEVEHKVEKNTAIWYNDLHFQTTHTLNTIIAPTKRLLVTLRSPI